MNTIFYASLHNRNVVVIIRLESGFGFCTNFIYARIYAIFRYFDFSVFENHKSIMYQCGVRMFLSKVVFVS